MSKYLLAVIGQSNEAGAGPAGSRGKTSGFAAPYLDKNSLRSWWPSCVQACGKRDVWLDVNNFAIGSTSLCDSWVGRCRTFASNMTVVRGTYVLSNGGIWKCNLAVSTASSATVAPTGTADTTGADNVPWIYIGAPAAGDTDGIVYTSSSARYDPNGYIAAAVNSLNDRPGYQEYGVYVSIGQGDYTVGSTTEQYTQAMINLAAHVTGLGRKCFLGVTVGMSGVDSPTRTARDAYMVNTIWAGRDAALVALSSNQLVKAGANLRQVIGVPSSTANDTALNSVNNVDYLHMTSATFDQAGIIVANALLAAGW